MLDANIIITAHELGIWDWLLQHYHVLVPSVVLRSEALFYYPSGRGQGRTRINLTTPAISGLLEEVSATVEEMAGIYARFDSAFSSGLHPGETEGLALLLAGRIPESRYCTADAAAIQALAMLGFSDCGVSLETLLAGKRTRIRLERQFSEDFLQRHLSQGLQNRIIGAGMVRGILD